MNGQEQNVGCRHLTQDEGEFHWDMLWAAGETQRRPDPTGADLEEEQMSEPNVSTSPTEEDPDPNEKL